MKRKSFMELLIKGEAEPGEIHDRIDEWHKDPRGKELHEFLGLTREEYSSWVEQNKSLNEIATDRTRLAS